MIFLLDFLFCTFEKTNHSTVGSKSLTTSENASLNLAFLLNHFIQIIKK